MPDYTGDITTFRTPGSRNAADIDVTASITNLRSTCNEQGGERIYSEATFDVLARRSDTREARRVELPYFATVLRGGSAVQSKRLGTVVIDFAPGQERAQARAVAGAFVDRAAATLPDDIRERITRRRRAGDPDAALDPLADPHVDGGDASLARGRDWRGQALDLIHQHAVALDREHFARDARDGLATEIEGACHDGVVGLELEEEFAQAGVGFEIGDGAVVVD